jgi:hypothetical protein
MPRKRAKITPEEVRELPEFKELKHAWASLMVAKFVEREITTPEQLIAIADEIDRETQALFQKALGKRVLDEAALARIAEIRVASKKKLVNAMFPGYYQD